MWMFDIPPNVPHRVTVSGVLEAREMCPWVGVIMQMQPELASVGWRAPDGPPEVIKPGLGAAFQVLKPQKR